MARRTVVVTGANGYIGNAVARAFSRAGWKTFGLIRRAEDAHDLARNEILPIIGSPADVKFLENADEMIFDVVVSNTEDQGDFAGHLQMVLTMLRSIASQSKQAGIRPLILFTSGCKDYGMTAEHGDVNLAPHTEQSPLNPPDYLVSRAQGGLTLLNQTDDLYDIIVLRPTTVYGYGSSYYGLFFGFASRSHSSCLLIPGSPTSIMHGTHVDDCAEAYVALAEHPKREEVINQAFNISNERYETAEEICEALGRSYGLQVEFMTPDKRPFLSVQTLVTFSQWVSSAKLRALTGWTDRRPAFAAGMDQYRLAFEAALKAKDRGTVNIFEKLLPENS
ncbi:MAG: hypothetical protein M1818_002964 [Claussenomyces sp. TS43310]|nr:MAG: hypothetical protein M1818_002964 [Claussenomyces sp. TS43310]